jgi:hypothetical protein
MQNETNQPQPTRPATDDSEQLRPPVTRWNLPAPRLQGVLFQSPVARVTTVTSPLRPPGLP